MGAYLETEKIRIQKEMKQTLGENKKRDLARNSQVLLFLYSLKVNFYGMIEINKKLNENGDL